MQAQALVQGTPGSLPLPFSSLDPSASMQWGSQGPDYRSGPLFLKQVRLVSPGLGIQYSSIAGGAEPHSAWGPAFYPSLLMWKAKVTMARWKVMMSHKHPRYYSLNEFCVLFMVANTVSLHCFINIW